MAEQSFTQTLVSLPRTALLKMVRLVRLLHRLSQAPQYRALVSPLLPESARFDPGHAAVMMGYDFHLTEEGPRLIEVNTNAGGGLLASRASFPEFTGEVAGLSAPLKQKLWQSFCREFGDYRKQPAQQPARIVIIDEDPASQFLYVEMSAFAALFRERGATVEIADPSELQASTEGVFINGQRVDLIYNRHCDFYLETEPMAALRSAYLAGAVCLTPNPHMYGLLADKARLALWSDPQQLTSLPLTQRDLGLLREVVPEAFLLTEERRASLWGEHKGWVFKPTTHYGSRGVLIGAKITRKRFNELPVETTLVQKRALPSFVEVPDHGAMKADFRLYAYRQNLLGVTARLYRGQVTNMRTEGGGFAPVQIV